MPRLVISAAAMNAFQQHAEDKLVRAIVDWAGRQIAWSLDTGDAGILEQRVQGAVGFGRARGIADPNDLALLFGVFCVQGPGLASDERFCDSLSRLQGMERRALLYDLLTGSLTPGADSGRRSAGWDAVGS